MISIDATTLPELLTQLRTACVARFKLDGLEIEFEATPPPPLPAPLQAPPPRMAPPETDPEKAPIHPIDAALEHPEFALPPVE